MKIIRDGNMLMVARNDFINLQESKDYFFITEEEFNDIFPTEAKLTNDEASYALNDPEFNRKNENRRNFVDGYNRALKDVKIKLKLL